MPRVRVVLAAYKHARPVGAAIDSVLQRTFQGFERLPAEDEDGMLVEGGADALPGRLVERPGDVDAVYLGGEVRGQPGDYHTSSRATPRMSISNSSPWMGGRLGNQRTPWMAAGPAGRRISSRRKL